MATVVSFVFPFVKDLVTGSKSGVMYPFCGIRFFFAHPALWGNLLFLAIPQLSLSFVVIVLSYLFMFPAQATLAFILNGPAGIVASFIGMFQQSMSIVRSISELVLFPKPLRILFDAVLVQTNTGELILKGRMQSPRPFEQSDYHRVVGWMLSIPRKLLFPSWLFMIVFRFLLSFIPLIGPAVMIFLDGPPTAKRCLGRYFDLKGWNETQIQAFIDERRWQFLFFGLLTASLETIPFVGFAFAFTNTIGGALWAVQIEEDNATALKKREYAKKNRLRRLR